MVPEGYLGCHQGFADDETTMKDLDCECYHKEMTMLSNYHPRTLKIDIICKFLPQITFAI